MERLNTAKDLLAKNKRKSEIRFGSKASEEIFDVGFYIGMLAFAEFMEDTIDLPVDISVEQLKMMNEEVKAYFDIHESDDKD